MPYKHIFFDLDHTLWDFDRNSRETLAELFEIYSLKNYGIHAFDDFVSTYKIVNDEKWDLYRKNKITKAELRATRFHDTLLAFEIEKSRFDFIKLIGINQALLKTKAPKKLSINILE